MPTPAEYIEKLSNNPEKIDKFYYYMGISIKLSNTNKKTFIRTTNLNNLRRKGVKTCFGIRNPTYILVFSDGPGFYNKWDAPFVIFVCSAKRWAVIEPSEHIDFFKEGMRPTSSLYKKVTDLKKNHLKEEIMSYSRGNFAYNSYLLGKYINYKLVEWNIVVEQTESSNLEQIKHFSFLKIIHNFVRSGMSPINLIKKEFLNKGRIEYSKEIYDKFHLDLDKEKVEECRIAHWGLDPDEIVTAKPFLISNKVKMEKEKKERLTFTEEQQLVQLINFSELIGWKNEE